MIAFQFFQFGHRKRLIGAIGLIHLQEMDDLKVILNENQNRGKRKRKRKSRKDRFNERVKEEEERDINQDTYLFEYYSNSP